MFTRAIIVRSCFLFIYSFFFTFFKKNFSLAVFDDNDDQFFYLPLCQESLFQRYSFYCLVLYCKNMKSRINKYLILGIINHISSSSSSLILISFFQKIKEKIFLSSFAHVKSTKDNFAIIMSNQRNIVCEHKIRYVQ